MNVNIIQNPQLRQAIQQGLNHIPLKPTKISLCIVTIIDAFEQLIGILGLVDLDFPISEARTWFHDTSLSRLKEAQRINKFGFRVSGEDFLSISAIKNEIAWITSKLFCSGLDKASNNCCFICIHHIRIMAAERLSGPNFRPCKENGFWLLRSHILLKVCGDLKDLLPEFTISHEALPYLMATYKQHKGKYRWLTNASHTAYTGIAHMLTIATMLILESIKLWAAEIATSYRHFMQVDTSLYWLVNSAVEVALNLPTTLSDVFVADVTRCYESILLEGEDNLTTTISHLIRVGFKEQAKSYPRATPKIWIRVDQEGQAARAKWTTSAPPGNWFSLDQHRLINLHTWLMCNCFVNLGDRVWQQISGIPMDFACSPLWCNMYLLFYESQFVQRLARLNRPDLMTRFKHAYRYIDDLCLINNGMVGQFLSAEQPRILDNPFWIYSLQVLEIKTEITRYADSDPTRGISAHFMNLDIAITNLDPSPMNFQLYKYDKRRDLPFSYAQYIVFRSNRPVRQSYGIVISQTMPMLHLSSDTICAAREIQRLISVLEHNGFRHSRLLEMVTTFLGSNEFPGIRFDINTLIEVLRYLANLS